MKRAPKGIQLNEVRFNGKGDAEDGGGKFYHINLLDRKDGEKAVQTELGPEAQVIILKLRRRIAGYKKDIEAYYVSTEHNEKADVVYMFGAKEKGRAEDLYEKYKTFIRAERVVYAYLLREGMEKELVRVIIKGSALNPNRDSKAPTTTDFFSYIQNKAKGEHVYMYVTKMTAVKEKNPMGSFYSIDFKKGAALNEKQLEEVIAKIKELHEYSVEQDAYYKVEDSEKVEVTKDALPVVEYPTDDIDPSDIPF